MRKLLFTVTLLANLLCFVLNARECRILASEYDRVQADTLFKVGAEWFPYPDYDDREGWNALFGNSAADVIAAAEKIIDYQWQVIPASSYLEYERSGDISRMENYQGSNRRALIVFMLAELAEGKGRFMNQLIDGLWMSAHLPSWVLSAHNPRQSSHRSLPDPREVIIDLGSGGYGAYMAIAYHFFHKEIDKVDPSITYSIEKAVEEKIFKPFMDKSVREANWWIAEGRKAGELVNNWNPWCNSNVLLCYLLMQKDQEKLSEAIRFSVESVDRFIDFVKSDGACVEGPSYWGHSAGKLYDYARLLYDASAGKYSVFDNNQICNMGKYISRSYIGNGWVVNFADATGALSPDPNLIYRFGKVLNDNEMVDFSMYLLYDRASGKFRVPQITFGDDAYRSLESVRYHADMCSQRDAVQKRLEVETSGEVLASLRSHVPSSIWYNETEFAYFRNKSGWFMAAKGGFNNESHNHNDVGTFILYIDDTPILVDAGVGTYTRQTFSDERYSIWTMQSQYHNLPVINGVAQKDGKDYKASDVSCRLESRSLSADISTAYPQEASCKKWVRSYVLKDKALHIRDVYSLTCRKAADLFHFLVLGKVYLPGNEYVMDGCKYVVDKGDVVIESGDLFVCLSYPENMKASVDEIQLTDPRLANVWGPSLRRLQLATSDDAPQEGTYIFKVQRL